VHLVLCFTQHWLLAPGRTPGRKVGPVFAHWTVIDFWDDTGCEVKDEQNHNGAPRRAAFVRTVVHLLCLSDRPDSEQWFCAGVSSDSMRMLRKLPCTTRLETRFKECSIFASVMVENHTAK